MKRVCEAALADGIVVVGAGQAGGRAVGALRAQGFTGAVTLIGDELHKPYERPSLSKEMLIEPSREIIAWAHADNYLEAQDIGFHAGVSARKIDRARRKVHLSNGREIGYGALILATGARVRRLDVPGGADANCFYLRTLDDSRALRQRLTPGSAVLVVGAGFIGLEVAAAAALRGCAVTVIETGTAPVGRVAPFELGEYLAQLHAGHGVSFRFSSQVTRFVRHGEKHSAVTQSGEEIRADTVVVGIGVIPNSGIAAEAGLVVDRGIVVDEFGATSDPHIFAAGDVARHYNTLLARHILLESWQNAQNQAIAVATNLTHPDAPKPFAEIPWFWTDQYDRNIQMYGLAQQEGETVIRGRKDGTWLLFQTKDDRIVFAAGVNAPRELRPARDLIASGAPISRAALVDTNVSMAELARAAKRERQPAH